MFEAVLYVMHRKKKSSENYHKLRVAVANFLKLKQEKNSDIKYFFIYCVLSKNSQF